MPYIKTVAIYSMVAILLSACQQKPQTSATESVDVVSDYAFPITNLSDDEYPDNPDIGFRSQDYQNQYFTKGAIKRQREGYDITFHSMTGDTLVLPQLQLDQYIPTVPEALKEDDYLSYLTLVNQEWNRNQVRFNPREFNATNGEIVRVDLARNCLNAYLWEIIVYIDEEAGTMPYAHGWFNFPQVLYAELFEEKNGMSYEQFRKPLEDWVTPENRPANLSLLRTILDTLTIGFADSSDAMYPVAAAREKKFKEIIHPESFETMRDLQNDSTLFATFTPPGFYNKADPRKTQLGRFYQLEKAEWFKVQSAISEDTLYELKLTFWDQKKERKTHFVVGGIDIAEFPVLPASGANSGWKSSMGFANHTFYETYQEHQACKTGQNPYYALLTDEEGRWLDSHEIGIDGPIFHFTDKERTRLNLWFLSFERHALVGHYVIQLPE